MASLTVSVSERSNVQRSSEGEPMFILGQQVKHIKYTGEFDLQKK